MAQLEALLADDDSDAIELFRDASTSLKAVLGAAHAKIKKALDNYDFVQALAVLRQTTVNNKDNKEEPVHE